MASGDVASIRALEARRRGEASDLADAIAAHGLGELATQLRAACGADGLAASAAELARVAQALVDGLEDAARFVSGLQRWSLISAPSVSAYALAIYLSSTVVDVIGERDELEALLPQLREQARSREMRLEVTDVRWLGSPADDAHDEELSLRTLRACAARSNGLHLVSLWGEQYGARVLARQLDSLQMRTLLLRMDRAERELFDSAFRLDSNALPPAYVYIGGISPEARDRLRTLLENLSSDGLEGAWLHADRHRLLIRSVVESEVDAAVCAIRSRVKDGDPVRIAWLRHRTGANGGLAAGAEPDASSGSSPVRTPRPAGLAQRANSVALRALGRGSAKVVPSASSAERAPLVGFNHWPPLAPSLGMRNLANVLATCAQPTGRSLESMALDWAHTARRGGRPGPDDGAGASGHKRHLWRDANAPQSGVLPQVPRSVSHEGQRPRSVWKAAGGGRWSSSARASSSSLGVRRGRGMTDSDQNSPASTRAASVVDLSTQSQRMSPILTAAERSSIIAQRTTVHGTLLPRPASPMGAGAHPTVAELQRDPLELTRPAKPAPRLSISHADGRDSFGSVPTTLGSRLSPGSPHSSVASVLPWEQIIDKSTREDGARLPPAADLSSGLPAPRTALCGCLPWRSRARDMEGSALSSAEREGKAAHSASAPPGLCLCQPAGASRARRQLGLVSFERQKQAELFAAHMLTHLGPACVQSRMLHARFASERGAFACALDALGSAGWACEYPSVRLERGGRVPLALAPAGARRSAARSASARTAADDFGALLASQLDLLDLRKQARARELQRVLGVRARVAQEWSAHAARARALALRFGGRGAEVEAVAGATCGVLALCGAPGNGTSSLLARAAFELSLRGSLVIYRRVGSSSSCRTVRDTIASVCEQWRATARTARAYSSLHAAVQSMGACKARIAIVLDALDEGDAEARAFDWRSALPRDAALVPPNVRFIVSLLPADHEGACGAWSQLHDCGAVSLDVGRLSEADAREVVDGVLAGAARTLTPKQRACVDAALGRMPSAQHAAFAARAAARWPSSLPEGECERALGKDAAECVRLEFGRLEKAHGISLASAVFGLLAVSRRGLAFCELLDALSLHDSLLAELFAHAPTPAILRAPSGAVRALLEDAWSLLEDEDAITLRSAAPPAGQRRKVGDPTQPPRGHRLQPLDKPASHTLPPELGAGKAAEACERGRKEVLGGGEARAAAPRAPRAPTLALGVCGGVLRWSSRTVRAVASELYGDHADISPLVEYWVGMWAAGGLRQVAAVQAATAVAQLPASMGAAGRSGSGSVSAAAVGAPSVLGQQSGTSLLGSRRGSGGFTAERVSAGGAAAPSEAAPLGRMTHPPHTRGLASQPVLLRGSLARRGADCAVVNERRLEELGWLLLQKGRYVSAASELTQSLEYVEARLRSGQAANLAQELARAAVGAADAAPALAERCRRMLRVLRTGPQPEALLSCALETPIGTSWAAEAFARRESGPKPGSTHSWEQARVASLALPRLLSDDALELCLRGHTGAVTCVCVSGDSQRAFSGGDDAAVRVWALATGECEHVLAGHGRDVTAVATDGRGSLVASASYDRTVRLWHVRSGQQLRAPLEHPKTVRAVALSADGALLASGCDDGCVRTWALPSGAPSHMLEAHVSWVRVLALSPDGSRLVSGGNDGLVRVWAAADGALLHSLEGHTREVHSIAISQDGKFVASNSGGRSLRVWNIDDGSCELVNTGELRSTCTAFVTSKGSKSSAPTDDEHYVVLDCSTDQTLRILAVKSNEWVHAFEGHTKQLLALASTSDGRTLLSAGRDGTVRVWSAAHRTATRRGDGHSNWVWAVGLSADGRRAVSASADGSVRIWDTQTGTCERALVGAHAGGVRAVALSADGKRLASGGGDLVRLWSARSGRCELTLMADSDGQPAQSPAPQSLSRAATTLTASMRAVLPAARAAAASPSTAKAAGGADAFEEGVSTRSSVNSLALSADGALLACTCQDGRLLLLDAATGTVEGTLHTQHGVTTCLSLSSDGRVLVSGGHDRAVCVWDAVASVAVRTLRSHADHVLCVDAGADGSTIASGGADGMILLWQSVRGHLARSLRGHRAAVHSVARSADGATIVSGSADLTVRVWNVASGVCARVLDRHSQGVTAVAVSADGSVIVSGSIDNSVRVWSWADDGDADGPPPPIVLEDDKQHGDAQGSTEEGKRVSARFTRAVNKIWPTRS